MTTIVYDHENKQIAIDGRLTKGGSTIISDSHIKYVKNDIGIWFFTGDVCDQKGFMNCYDKEEIQQAVTYNASAILVIGKDVYSAYMDDGYFCKMLIDHNECKGSGELLALAALDHGESALNAINYAMTRDMFTGGKVNVYDIEKGEFL